MKKDVRKLIIKWGFKVLIGAILLMLLVNFYMIEAVDEKIFANFDDLPEVKTVLILGAGVRADGRMSDILRDRVEKGLELYEGGKVAKILVSGDHGRANYDEVNVVKDFLLAHGVLAEDIFLDHAGFDTYDSLFRAKAIFGVHDLIVVTQKFHLSRAVYVGDGLGMEVYGYIADRQTYRDAFRLALRELLARSKSFLDVLLRAKPKFLGEEIAIGGDGQKSWD